MADIKGSVSVIELVGNIDSVANIGGSVRSDVELTGVVSVGSGEIVDEYTGKYMVVPLADEEQILETKNKKMTDNVTVKKVPYFETSNEDGTTVYIASEVEIYG